MPQIFESLDFSKAMLFGARTWESQLGATQSAMGARHDASSIRMLTSTVSALRLSTTSPPILRAEKNNKI